MAVNIDNFQVDPEQFIIVPPTSLTIAEKTIIDRTLNVKLYGFAAANISGGAVLVTITDGNGNEILKNGSFDTATSQFVPTEPGYFMMNGIKASSDVDDGVVLWLQVKKM